MRRYRCLTVHLFFLQGTDIKSLAINMASIMLFVIPFVAYFDLMEIKQYSGLLGGAFVFAYVMPPVGWRRPHPYSDDPRNVPP